METGAIVNYLHLRVPSMNKGILLSKEMQVIALNYCELIVIAIMHANPMRQTSFASFKDSGKLENAATKARVMHYDPLLLGKV